MLKRKACSEVLYKVSRASHKQTIMHVIIICLLVSVPLAKCLIKTTLETRELHIGLDGSGGLLNPSNIPSCTNGEKILLKTYKYEYAECDYIDECVFSNEEELLPLEKLRLHEMCSLRDNCHNLTFPLRNSLQKSRTNAIYIKYQCIDPRSNVIDICETQTIAFNDTFYLTVTAKAMSGNVYCQCTIQNGFFTLSLRDVRLKIKGIDNCSSSTLHINRLEFSCNPNRIDFSSKFGRVFNQRMANVYIGFSYNPEDAEPEMVWLEGKPKETASVFCSSSPSQKRDNAESRTEKRTSVNRISTTTNSIDLSSAVSSDWPGTKPTTVETTETSTNYTPISNDADCFLGLYKLNDSCVISCPDHYYEHTETVEVPSTTARRVFQERGICFRCSEACQTCNGPHVSNCLTCSNDFTRQDGVCQRKVDTKDIDPVPWGLVIVFGVFLFLALTVLTLLYKNKTSGLQNSSNVTYNNGNSDDSNRVLIKTL